jgi:hypothetical protein
MYYSPKYEVQWSTPPRTASRMTKEILQKLGFNELYGHHTIVNIRNEWELIVNVRNPYAVAVSMWILTYMAAIRGKRPIPTFLEHTLSLDRPTSSYHMEWGPSHFLQIFNRNPDRVIRYENFAEDIMNVPFIKDNSKLLQNEIDKLHQGDVPWIDNYPEEVKRPYHEFYDQELANIVYRQRKLEFDNFGYDPNSWRTLVK